MKKKDLSVPIEQTDDVTHSFVKGLIDTFPGIGSVVAELFGHILPQPIEKRRVKWMTDVAESIYDLQKNSEVDIESLRENPAFISVLMEATQIAQRNHHEEKITALRNAVLNTAKEIDIAENIQLMFIGIIDDFTVLHLKLLAYLHNPEKWLKDREIQKNYTMGGVSTYIEFGIPELKEEKELLIPLATDLFNKGMINTEGRMFNALMTESGMLAKRTTKIGESFLRYIGVV